jgi:cell division protein FtsB
MQSKKHKLDKKATKRRLLWKLLLCVVFLAFIAIDGYRFFNIFQSWRINGEIKQEYLEAVDKLRKEQEQLKQEIHDLKYRRLTQERLAREMGYIKPGETVYKLSPKMDEALSEELR